MDLLPLSPLSVKKYIYVSSIALELPDDTSQAAKQAIAVTIVVVAVAIVVAIKVVVITVVVVIPSAMATPIVVVPVAIPVVVAIVVAPPVMTCLSRRVETKGDGESKQESSKSHYLFSSVVKSGFHD